MNFHNSKIMELIHAKINYIWVFSFDYQLLCLMNIVWFLPCYLICMWLFYTWVNLISMITYYYLLLWYALTPILFIYSSCITCFHCMTIPWYLLVSLLIVISVLPLFSRNPFFRGLEGYYGSSSYLFNR